MSPNPTHKSSGCGCMLLTLLAGGVVVWLISFYWGRPRYYHQEAITYVGAINRAHQAYYVETGKWTAEIDRLRLGIDTETKNYRYNVVILSETAVQSNGVSKPPSQGRFLTIRKFLRNYFDLGNYVERSLRSYTGLVRVVEDENGETKTVTTLCESLDPTSQPPADFSFPDVVQSTDLVLCPDGYRALF